MTDMNIHVVPKGDEVVEQPVNSKNLEPAAHNGGYFRLIRAKPMCRLDLCQSATLNCFTDGPSDL